jgi:dimethylsulfoniopropionate demethylase
MAFPGLSISRRIRSTPYTERVREAGVKAFTVYNHMLLPTVFESLEADYLHLREHVQVWDVACQRQIEIRGEDALRLTQMVTPRALGDVAVGRCLYVPAVDAAGGMLNDPVLLRLGEDCFWLSLADADLYLWVRALADAYQLNVTITEPDVWPLAVQGPKAEQLMAQVFGDQVIDIGFFRFEYLDFLGQWLLVARSGYSQQDGFEVYAQPYVTAQVLWDALFEAGSDFCVRAGCPNLIDRVEGGLLSYGNDMTRANTPFECAMERFCQPVDAIGCLGRDALIAVAQNEPVRRVCGVRIDGEPVPACEALWSAYCEDGLAGSVSSAVWSPTFATNVGIAMMNQGYWEPGTEIEVEVPGGVRSARICPLPHR